MEEDIDQIGSPKRQLSLIDAIAIIVGIVIGAGIFRTPPLIAANTGSDSILLLVWILGGVVSLIGALCYAELTTAFPNAGGDYHFLGRAYGKRPAFLFAWARMSIIQTGSIALLAYIFGDYITQIHNLGEFSSVIYAAFLVVLLTAINIAGVRLGTGAQKLFTLAELSGVLLIIVGGLFFASASVETAGTITEGSNSSSSSIGLAMVFVLLTFGGWNEAAYISAEIKPGGKRMVKALIISLIVITIVYLLINISFIKVLGHNNLSKSTAVGSDIMQAIFGPVGVVFISILVAISALTSANATIFTGARTNYALGMDFSMFAALGKWNNRTSGPVNAFLIQGVISLILISLGLFTRSGFETIIEYTAPVFWFFFLLIGIAVFVLRKKEPNAHRPFRVPLYPVTPIVFCASSAYLLYSSLMYTGIGAIVGIGVLAIGGILLFIFPKKASKKQSEQTNEVFVN